MRSAMRDPVDELAQFTFQWRHIELGRHILHAVVQARIGRGVLGPDHASGLAARTQRHGDDIAGRQIEARRNPVGIGRIERDRHQDIDDARAHGVRSGRFRPLKEG
jgi:hypothetical protein